MVQNMMLQPQVNRARQQHRWKQRAAGVTFRKKKKKKVTPRFDIFKLK